MNLILLNPSELEMATPRAPGDGGASTIPAGSGFRGRVRLTDARATHVRTVLGGAVGGRLRVGLVDGPLGKARIVGMEAGAVELECRFEGSVPPRPRVDLLLAMPRPKVLRRLWAPCAALGVGRILVTQAWKVERCYFDSHVLDPRVYRPLLLEGLQQAGDTRLPRVSIHRRFKVLLEEELDRLCPQRLRWMGHPRSCRVSALDGPPEPPASRLLLAVGPEGGWTDYETERLVEHGFKKVSAGERVLRSDTACVALLTLAHVRLSVPGRGTAGAEGRRGVPPPAGYSVRRRTGAASG